MPVVLEYPIEQIGHITYYLAPKVEEDDDDNGQLENEQSDDI